MGKLSALAIKAAKKPGRYYDGDGLMLVIKPSGARSWVLRVQSRGRRRDFGLGSANEIGLLEARTAALETRKLLRAGIDPVSARKGSQDSPETIPTFREAANAAHAELAAGWNNLKHRAQWLSTLEAYVFPTLGDKPVDRIDASMIVDALRPVWLQKEETARRVKQRICSVLDWSHGKGWRTTEAPKRAIDKLSSRQRRKTKHFVAMPYAEVPQFMAQLSRSASFSRLALRFLILTAARSGEVRGAKWAEIDLAARLWTISGDRMKAGNEHVVPLSDDAIEVLKIALSGRIGGKADLVFPGLSSKPLSDMTLTKALRATKATKATVHGFRSSFRDWAAERTEYSDAVVEAALAHTNRNRVEAAYRRTNFLEKRQQLMQSWADFLGS